jgi:hypothetical protein
MGQKGHYPQKLLKASRDASNMYLSRIPLKEFYETKDVYKKTIPHILKKLHISRFHTVHDFCAGHGANCPYIVSRNKAKFAIAHNIHAPLSSERLWRRYPRIAGRLTYKEEDIYTTEYNLEDNSLVLAIHPCSNLAHRVVEIAIENRAPVVVSPCCVGKRKNSLISKFDNVPRYTQWCIAVAEPLDRAGYDIQVRYIRAGATPVNTIIMGIPK